MNNSTRPSSKMHALVVVVFSCIFTLMFIFLILTLSSVKFQGRFAILNNRGLYLLSIPLAGLFVIFRHGKWTGWKVVKSSTPCSLAFWCGWTIALIVAVLQLLGL